MNELLTVGDIFSKTFRVTREVYEAFVRCSGDVNPLHTDDSYAQALGYPGKLMHGALLNAFVSGFVGTALPTQKTLCLSQHINYRRPFFLNNEVLLEATVENIQSLEERQLYVEFKLRFRVQKVLIASGTLEVRLSE